VKRYKLLSGLSHVDTRPTYSQPDSVPHHRRPLSIELNSDIGSSDSISENSIDLRGVDIWLGHWGGKGKRSKRKCEDGSHEHHCVSQCYEMIVMKREW